MFVVFLLLLFVCSIVHAKASARMPPPLFSSSSHNHKLKLGLGLYSLDVTMYSQGASPTLVQHLVIKRKNLNLNRRDPLTQNSTRQTTDRDKTSTESLILISVFQLT